MIDRTCTTALLGALLAAACAVSPPPHAVDTDFGIVRGESPDAAEEVAVHLERLEPRVRDALIETRERGTAGWVMRVLRRSRFERSPEQVSGFTRFVDREPLRIYLRESADPRWALAHELVHVLAGPTWDALPGVLSEGLADVVAGRVSRDLEPKARAVRLLNASVFFGGIAFQILYDRPDPGPRRELEAEVWYSYREDAARPEPRLALEQDRWELNRELKYLPETYYGIGYVVVHRIVERDGLKGLHELCREAQAAGREVVPVEWLLEAAELDGADDWNAAIAGLLGEEEAREIHALLPELFPGLAVLLFGPAFGDELEGDEFLDRVNPRLVLADGSDLEIARLPGARESILAAWPR